MEQNKQTVVMTAEELTELEAFRAAKAKKEAEEKIRQDRIAYDKMVNEAVDVTITQLISTSDLLKSTKDTVLKNFNSALEMKLDLFKVRDGQASHTFTNSEGTKRVIIGYNINDGYRDTVNEGIEIVREYIQSLAADDKSKMLVNAVLRLLSKDAKGTLKASRVLQLRKLANESGDERFMDGVKIIENAYSPTISSMYVRAAIRKGDNWENIALGMTEA